jgi:hypothetical protein
MRCTYSGAISPQHIIIIDDAKLLKRKQRQVEYAVKAGAVALVLEFPVGKHGVAGRKLEIEECGMSPINFVSRDTGHVFVKDFKPNDFRLWYDAKQDRPNVMASTIIAHTKRWKPILKTGNGGWTMPWKPAFACVEAKQGRGYWRVCQVQLSGRIKGNPVAEIFARRLISM